MAVPRSIFRQSTQAWRRRQRDAMVPRTWDGAAVAAEIRAEVEQAEVMGILDPRLLDAFEAGIVEMIEQAMTEAAAEVRDSVGSTVAERVFGDSLYANRLDRQLATGASAVAEAVVEEMLAVVASAVSLRFFSDRRTPAAVWPTSFPVVAFDVDGGEGGFADGGDSGAVGFDILGEGA